MVILDPRPTEWMGNSDNLLKEDQGCLLQRSTSPGSPEVDSNLTPTGRLTTFIGSYHYCFSLDKDTMDNHLSTIRSQSQVTCLRIRVDMSIFSQPGLVVCVVCVCPIIIKLGQMIEEGLCIT